MALVNCPECLRQVSDRASSCPQCGCPISTSERLSVAPAAVVHASAVRAEDPMKPATWTCENCGTVGAYRRFEILHQEGTKAVSSQSSTIAMSGRGDIGVAQTGTTGHSATTLASAVAPPQMATNQAGCLGAVAAVCGLFGVVGLANGQDGAGFGAFMLLVAAVFGFIWYTSSKGTVALNADFPARVDEWKRKYKCMACGATRILPA